MDRTPTVYILANGHNGALYTGVTSDLLARIAQHRAGTFDGHTKRYDITRLVWFEVHATMEAAIVREKRIKGWRRDWRKALFAETNPTWRDLAEDFGFEPLIKRRPSRT